MALIRLVPPNDYDGVVRDLCENSGVAVMELSDETAACHKRCLETSRRALSDLHHQKQTIGEEEDAAHATGYHPAGGVLSRRYNRYREGFVFSDGQMIGDDELFATDMRALFDSLHHQVTRVLASFETRWHLPTDWFQQHLGPTNTCSQWHVKRYVETDNNNDDDDDDDWLPMHTDPSILSVVIHDAIGIRDGAMGLECQIASQGEKQWVEIPHHGHGVATIFVGSLLSYMTKGFVPSCKHRVVKKKNAKDRLAATLFLRPQPSAWLQMPPSPLFRGALKKRLTFETWNKRVSRNYSSKKQQQQQQQQQQYYRDDITELSLLSCDPPLTGREKYLGGALGENGKIYTIPGHAKRVLVMDHDTIRPIGPVFSGEYKWLRAVSMRGIIYGIPCHADSVLRIDPRTDRVTTLLWDHNDPRAPPKGTPWKWHGGCVSPHDGCLYCVPQYAQHVMKLDPNEKITFLGDEPLVGKNKWYGGVLAPSDGAIYGINQNASGVLRIDPGGKVSVHGDFSEGGYKWHGGVLGPDGCVYGIPAHSSCILKIVPGDPPIVTTMNSDRPLRTGQHRRGDGKYKYLGGAVGHDDKIYLFPSDADYVLQIDPYEETIREVGPNLRRLESIHQNKWQNGFAAHDGTIYGIPLKSSSILRIQTNKEKDDPVITTIGGPYTGLNKWEGGVMDHNGDMYCMPLNHAKVLRIRPVKTRKPRSRDEKRIPQYATLRSSSHTLRYSRTRAKGLDSGPVVTKPLPNVLRAKQIISGYDPNEHDLRGSVTRMLRQQQWKHLLGGWKSGCEELERFCIPKESLQPNRPDHPTGNGDEAQRVLSELVANDKEFLRAFDDFVDRVVLPWIKTMLQETKAIVFYCQRPPTLRLQPGPSDRYVRPHRDSDYGHQDGEVNMWMPLTDPLLTQTDLWVSTSNDNDDDYEPLGVKLGQVAAFHGTSCRHYVPANPTLYTRVSLDFRVGIQGCFDPNWKMLGTKADHNRRIITL